MTDSKKKEALASLQELRAESYKLKNDIEIFSNLREKSYCSVDDNEDLKKSEDDLKKDFYHFDDRFNKAELQIKSLDTGHWDIVLSLHEELTNVRSRINLLYDRFRKISESYSKKAGATAALRKDQEIAEKRENQLEKFVNITNKEEIKKCGFGDVEQKVTDITVLQSEYDKAKSRLQQINTDKLKFELKLIYDKTMLFVNGRMREIHEAISCGNTYEVTRTIDHITTQIEIIIASFKEANIEILETYHGNNVVQKQKILEFQYKSESILAKIVYKGEKLSFIQMQKQITNIRSDITFFNDTEKDNAKRDLDQISIKIDDLLTTFKSDFNNAKNEINCPSNRSAQEDFVITYQTLCEKNKATVLTLRLELNEIDYKHRFLCQSIITTATQMGLQLKNQNGFSIYKFPVRETQRDSAHKLRGFESGQLRTDKDHHQVLLVGMTGSGKSLLVNSMINYIYGVSHRDKFRFKLIDEWEEIAERDEGASCSLADSMTSWVSSYTFHWQEGFRIPYSLTIIDTPGFGDTRGLKYDEQIVGQLRYFFNDNKLCPHQELSSIGFVIQASQARLTQEQTYIFDQILNIFGKDMKDNIMIIFTFADNQPPPALEVVRSRLIPFAEYYKFNNSSLYAPIDRDYSQRAWQFVLHDLEKYFENMLMQNKISLCLSREVLDEREKLRMTLTALQIEISEGMETLRMIEEQSRAIINLNGTIQSNKSFKVKKQIYKYDIEAVNHSVTNCGNCNFTCHDPCSCGIGGSKTNCPAIRNGNCIMCPRKCSYTSHTNGKHKFVYTTIEVEETIEEITKVYNVAVAEKRSKKQLLENMLTRYREQKATIFKCITDANSCSNRLEEISLRSSYLTNVEYIERLIQLEERKSHRHKRERIAQLRNLRDMAESLRGARETPEALPRVISAYEYRMDCLIAKIDQKSPFRPSCLSK